MTELNTDGIFDTGASYYFYALDPKLKQTYTFYIEARDNKTPTPSYGTLN